MNRLATSMIVFAYSAYAVKMNSQLQTTQHASHFAETGPHKTQEKSLV